MVIKSLTVTEDAYDALKALKYGDESFSETILRISSDKRGNAAKFFGALKDTDVAGLREMLKDRRVEIEKECVKRAGRFKKL